MLEKLKKLWEGNSGSKKLKPLHYLIVVLGIGIAAMILTDFLRVEKDAPLGFIGGTETDATSGASSAGWFGGGGGGGGGGDGTGGDSAAPAIGGSPAPDIIAEYENNYAAHLRDILASVVGVGEVDVMVNLESTPELVMAENRNNRSSTNQEMDKDRATRNQNDQTKDSEVVIVQGGKQDSPVIVKTMKPRVRGVLVVAKGADNIQVKAWITEAVQKVLDVPAYKISILPKKG
ncbi:stage III sporulation protein AG [Brevibacillus centrosporus]|uniref:stage III sporulation protein AG n=2 Tax=Brevibacillus centrosporus TaxID=54910 RepID=UPI001144154B|nr:stage III sporulation protein AG [Brevibacillus centrosporus]MEC2132618.1 stage III sporulation protein AG [Brevibacillus centrosporus]GED29557.1 stage III sporulation protein AG [Brevibacillus centrosporus]